MRLRKRISIIFIALLSVLVVIPSAFAYSVTISGLANIPEDIHGFTLWFDVSDDFDFSNFSFGDAIPSGGTLGWSEDPVPNIDASTLKVGGVDQDFLFLSAPGFQMTDGTILSFDIVAGTITPLGLGSREVIQFDPGDGTNLFNDKILLGVSDINGANFAVPIPSALLLLGGGIIGLLGIRRKFKE